MNRDGAILAGIVCVALAFGAGWWTGRAAARDRCRMEHRVLPTAGEQIRALEDLEVRLRIRRARTAQLVEVRRLHCVWLARRAGRSAASC